MKGILLTQDTTPILGFIAKILGIIMEGIFTVIDFIGIPNIGLAIILFTIVVNLLMLPLTIKQQKFAKLSAKIQPEIQAIQAKYKNRTDQESKIAANQETQAIYAKYGISPTGSCLYLLIQMPILFSLYKVIYAIPAYVTKIGDTFKVLAQRIMDVDGAKFLLNSGSEGIQKTVQMYGSHITDTSEASVNGVIDVLNRLSSTDMATVSAQYGLSGLEQNGQAILGNEGLIEKYNNFLGLNIGDAPLDIIREAISTGAILLVIGAALIPILSVVTQWLNTKLMPQNNTNANGSMGSSMKTMNIIMPLISGWFAFTWASGMGIYWIAGNVVRCIQQVVINKHIDKLDFEEIIAQNSEKSAKKLEKLKANQERMNAYANMKTRNIQNRASVPAAMSDADKEQAMKKSTEYYNSGNAKPGSMMSKANMVKQFNEKNNKDN